jgi:hypothetical protein
MSKITLKVPSEHVEWFRNELSGEVHIKQVADWLGHADPAFCLRTYISLMDAGVGDADFLDNVIGAQVGNNWATGHPVRGACGPDAEPAKTAL